MLAGVTADKSLKDGVFFLSGCFFAEAHQLIAAVSQLAGSLINLASVPLLRPVSKIIHTASHIV